VVLFSGLRSGAYWEAGFGFGLGKEVILCCKREKDEAISKLVHFDQNHFNIIFYENEEKLREELKYRIKSIPGLIP